MAATDTTLSGETPAEEHRRRGELPAELRVSSSRIGRFTLLGDLGEGGMGVVYAAYDEALDRRVAIKMVRTDRRGGDAHARMLREAKALAQLSHPNVVQVYEVSASAGRIFIAMEYVRGSTLRAMLEGRRRGAPMQEVLDLFLQAGRGLAAAHAVGLVHRDFKVDNVIVGEDGRVRVIDFGLATALDLDDADEGDATLPEGIGVASPRLTATNAILGTPAYMSPEQLAGQPVDARADQFSYCVALYEALCGRRPFPGGSPPEILQAIAQGVRQGASGALPEWLAAVLRRGLAFDPGARFPSMQALLDALGRNPGARRRQRRRALALVTAGVAIAALVALLVIEIGRRWAEHGRERDASAALTAAEARIGETRAAGDDAHARELFAAFVDDPAHDGTRALARAWLAEAERRLADGAQDGAREALAAAYASAPAPDLQVTALRGLAGLLREGRRWDALAGLLALLDREHPDTTADIAGLHVDAALARRDLPGARQYLALAADPRSALVEALLPATSTVHRDLLEVHSTGPHTLLHHVYSGSPRLDRVRSAPSLEPAATLAPVEGTDWLVFVHGDPTLVVGYERASRTNTLYRIAEASLDPLHRWRGPQVLVGASSDLDGDGRRELYLGTGTGLEIIEVIAEAGGYREVVVYSTADTLESLPHAMLAADLDGDGRDELALSFTGWWAYDIRVLRRGPGGHLVTAARDKIGSVRDLNTLRDAAGRRLLVSLNAGREENTLIFPPDHPKGDDEGLYLHAFDGQRLTRVLHLPLLAASDGVGWFRGVIVADVDGNGLDDIIVSFEEEGEGSVHALIHLQVDGGFTPVLLGHLHVLAAAQLDDEPAQELIVGASGGDPSRRVWVLGAGDGPLPPVPAPSIAAPRPIDSDDPAWTRRWRQAEVLHELGLDAAAADAFERLARGAPTPLLRAAASLQAGDLRVRLGEHRPALALLHAAARDPGLRSDGLRKVLALEIRLGDYEAAEATLDEIGGDLDPELTALAALVRHARAEHVELRLDRGLDPAWSIEDPLAIRRVPGEDGIDLATLSGGEVLSLPVLWSGALLDLSVDLTFVEGEATSSVEVAIVPEDDPGAAALLAVRMTSIGSQRGGIVRRELWFDGAGESRAIPLDQSGRASSDPQRVRIRASLHPDRREFGVALDDPRAGTSLARFDPIARPLPAAGRYRLIVRSRIESRAWLRARLHRIDVRGARVAPEPAAAGAAAFRRAIVEGDPVAVLAAAGALVEPSVDERLAQAHAHLQVGEVAAARAIWSELLAADVPPPRALLQLLRANPELYGPHLRELLGARYFGLLADVWRAAAVNHLGDPRPRQALHAVLATLDAAELLAVDDPALFAAACELLRWRAAIHGRTGDLIRARADLERVVASLDRLPAEAPLRAIRWQIWLDLASMAAQDGDPRRARAAIDAALEVSAAPGIVGDVVRARPELAALGG
ncbi:MAG: protein kinase [Nannocystis sp.]|nr:protein kinase [Nannocystis sp.]